MLDAFIIERLKKERQKRETPGLTPLRIERPPPEDDPRWRNERQRRREDEQDSDRGIVIVDFNI